MSLDIQVISIVDDLQVTSVEEIPEADPRTLRLVAASGFNGAQRVLINDFGIDAFTLVTDQVMLVSPGSTFDSVVVSNMRIVVVSNQLTGTRRVRLVLGPTNRLKSISGPQKLVQQAVKMLLSNTGSNRFRPQEGGDLIRLLGFQFNPGSKGRLSSTLAQSVSAVEEQLIASQASLRRLPDDERLRSFTLGGIAFLEDTLEVEATINLTTYAGRSVSFPLVL